MTDWGAHYVDTAQWANDCDHTGPVSVEGVGTFLEGGIYNTAEFFDINYQYANGVEMQVKSGGTAIGFEGSEGWIQCIGWRGDMTASTDKILKAELKSSEPIKSRYASSSACHSNVDAFTKYVPTAAIEVGFLEFSTCSHSSSSPATFEKLVKSGSL